MTLKRLKKYKKQLKKKEEDVDLDPNFDDNSLQIYGYMLNEQLEKSQPGKEVAKP